MKAYRPTWLEISPANLQYNCETVRKLVGNDVKICAVVKANGYGHGAVEVSKACPGGWRGFFGCGYAW